MKIIIFKSAYLKLKTAKTIGKPYTKIKLTVPPKKSPTDYFPNHARDTKKRAEQEVLSSIVHIAIYWKHQFSVIMFGKSFFISNPLLITSWLHPLLLQNQSKCIH